MFKGVKRVLCVGIDKRCSYAFLLILYGFLLSTKMTTPEIWKPMHMQPIYQKNAFVTREGMTKADAGKGADGMLLDVGRDIFHRGVCLPSDNKMTAEQQERVIEVVRACFE